jgi:hypothetical protein
MFLDFLWYPLFPIMLTLGLFLRILYFTRKLGGMLIALSLALYIVFPMFYVLTNGILFGFMHHAAADTSWSFGSTYNSDPVTGTPLPAYETPLNLTQRAKSVFSNPSLSVDLCSAASETDVGAMNATMDSIRGDFGKFENGKWYSQALEFATHGAFSETGPIAKLALLMVFTIFIPFLALMTTLAAFKAFSPLIGGDVEISLLSRLI